MTMKEVLTFDSARKIWNRVVKSADHLPLAFDLEVHKRLLNLFHIGPYYYYVFNCSTAGFDYLDQQASEITGYRIDELSPHFFLGIVHPEDASYVVDFEDKITSFYEQLPFEKLMSYKSSYDYRIMLRDGRYIRILQQVTVIQVGGDGSIFRTFGVHTDISHLKSKGTPVLNIMELNGAQIASNFACRLTAGGGGVSLTQRELQIVRLMADGHYSDQIADLLHISVNTVKTHRRNIMAKTACKSPGELVRLAIQSGWL